MNKVLCYVKMTDLAFSHAEQCSSLHIDQQFTPATVDEAAHLFVAGVLCDTFACANINSW